MALKRNLALMGSTLAIRLGAGLLTFAVLARILGPESFGVLMFGISVGSMAALGVGFGLVPYVLKEGSATPGSLKRMIDESLTGMLLLAGLVLAVAALVGITVSVGPAGLIVMLIAALLADAISEMLNAALRSRDRFDVETKTTAIGSVFHTLVLCGVASFTKSLEWVALAFLISRMTVLMMVFTSVSIYVERPVLTSVAAALKRLKLAKAYAMDSTLQGSFGQVDSLVLNWFLGPAAVGIYQAGMRLFQSGAQVATVLSNVFLPRMSRSSLSASERDVEARKLLAVFLFVGTAFGLFLAVFSESIVLSVFGPKYAELISHLPLFGLLFFLRFGAGAWGILLTAVGQQGFRVVCSVVFWSLVLAASYWLVPAFGVDGWLIALSASTFLLIVVYAIRSSRYFGITALQIFCPAFGALLFVPLIWR